VPRDNGFTLLELLVVLAIMSLVVAITLPNLRLPGFASDTARAARQIASGLADARQQAIHTNLENAFVVDLAQHSYQIASKPPVSLKGIESLTLLTAERGVIDGSRGMIRFYPDGSSDGGELSVKGGDGARITIRVNWLTGRISHDG
jgi:general secretion pathway protein H